MRYCLENISLFSLSLPSAMNTVKPSLQASHGSPRQAELRWGEEMMKTTPGAILECTVSHQHRAKKKRPLENSLVPNSLGKKFSCLSPNKKPFHSRIKFIQDI